MLVAVGDTKEVIDEHWKVLNESLLAKAKSIDEKLGPDALKYMISKITSWHITEEGEEGKQQKIEDFHNEFDSLLNGQKLITYYIGGIWMDGKPTPRPATLYITGTHICVHTLHKKIIWSFKDISLMSKESTLGVIPNMIKFVIRKEVQAKDGDKDSATTMNYWFVMVSERDSAFNTLEELWSFNLSRWQKELDPEDHTDNIFDFNSKAVITAFVKNRAFHNRFLVPEDPVSEYYPSLCNDMLQFPGIIILSPSFLCWSSSCHKMKTVICIKKIKHLEKQRGHIHLETDNGNTFSFRTPNIEDLYYNVLTTKTKQEPKKNLNKEHAPHKRNPNGYKMYSQKENDSMYQKQQKEMQERWEKYFSNYGKGSSIIISENEFVYNVYCGIPDIYRGEIWTLSSGAIHKMDAYENKYPEYLASIDLEKNAVPICEIERDLYRSIPSHPYYDLSVKIPFVRLKNVLVAYISRNPSIGYCQGMNIIAATLLLYMSEEEAFWTLVSIVEEITPDYYDKQLFGSVVDQKVFSKLIRKRMPELYQHLKELKLPVSIISLPWFMKFMIDCVSWEVSLQCFDKILLLGTSAMFQLGLAMLYITQDQIILETEDHEKVLHILKTYPFESADFIEVISNNFRDLDPDTIKKMRNKEKAKILREMQRS
ncbi:TBC1 domain family member 8B-like isoform X2 [Schistocerca gregaria]|nr:TBC1 domain family member 8B-like isoform X2 [Schistocerca gregaria]